MIERMEIRLWSIRSVKPVCKQRAVLFLITAERLSEAIFPQTTINGREAMKIVLSKCKCANRAHDLQPKHARRHEISPQVRFAMGLCFM